MDAGEPIAMGTAAEIRNDPKVIAAYLGDGATSAKPRGQALATSETPVLETLELTAGYGAAPVLRSVSMKVRAGEMVALLGANGAGKSTFLSALSGLLRPVEGAIVLSDEAIQRRPPHSIVEQGLILVPEGRQVFPELTAREKSSWEPTSVEQRSRPARSRPFWNASHGCGIVWIRKPVSCPAASSR
jgi:ABC-type branched-subunit amino acid transport system ATPase component